MKIVIDIPEETVNEIKDNVMFADNISSDIRWGITSAIVNGTILPKGHGKLVDIEDVKNNIRKWRGYLDEDMMGRICFAMDNHIPTIIDADMRGDE